MMVAEVTFWLSIAVLVFVYFGYPAMVYCIGRLSGRPIRKMDSVPSVTVLIAAYNEQDYIEETIRNKLVQNYPPDNLEVIVVSDGSTDETDQRVTELGQQFPGRVKLLRQEPRSGKTSALNHAIGEVRTDIVVFSDANSLYAPDAISKLVRNFADPDVGYVTGRMVYVTDAESAAGEGCTTYMRYENFLREQETRAGSIVGVDGGIDAVRRTLYSPMRADQLPDFVLPLKVVERGYRVVYEAEAVLREKALGDTSDEYRMRVRVSLRALWALWDMRHLLNAFRYGRFAFQMLSHKVLRYAVFIFLLTAALSNIWLAGTALVYSLSMLGQVVFYVLAAIGYFRSRGGKQSMLGFIPYYFLLLNLASAQAFYKFAMGQKQVIWSPRTG